MGDGSRRRPLLSNSAVALACITKQPPARGEVYAALADRTGGMYVSTETVDELAVALRETLGCALIGRAPARPATSAG